MFAISEATRERTGVSHFHCGGRRSNTRRSALGAGGWVMGRVVAFTVVVIGLAAGVTIAGLSIWLVSLGGGALAVIVWRLTSCRHPGPLGLLPATTDLDGSIVPPRWFCDACGATWTAHFEKAQTPVRRFSGYDQTKAVTAAKRAAELADRQHVLALRRAGLRPASTAHATAARSTSRKAKAPVE